jgi:hypothetical protein
VGRDADPEVPVDDRRLQVLRVLLVQRLVEAVELLVLLEQFGRGSLAEQRLGRRARTQKKSRMESPSRIGTSSSSRRTTKRNIVRRLLGAHAVTARR